MVRITKFQLKQGFGWRHSQQRPWLAYNSYRFRHWHIFKGKCRPSPRPYHPEKSTFIRLILSLLWSTRSSSQFWLFISFPWYDYIKRKKKQKVQSFFTKIVKLRLCLNLKIWELKGEILRVKVRVRVRDFFKGNSLFSRLALRICITIKFSTYARQFRAIL